MGCGGTKATGADGGASGLSKVSITSPEVRTAPVCSEIHALTGVVEMMWCFDRGRVLAAQGRTAENQEVHQYC